MTYSRVHDGMPYGDDTENLIELSKRHQNRELLSISKYRLLLARLAAFTEQFVPSGCYNDAESLRRARLVIRFGLLGFLFGMLYAGLYFLIHHYWGAGIVAVCSLGFVATPIILKRTGALNLCGHILSFLLTFGFTALCVVEGGMEGHAIAWLSSVPLCTLLVVGRRAALGWVLTCFLVIAGVIAAGVAGIHMPRTYPPEWDTLISAAGYLGLIPFMFLLGMIFELSREKAFDKLFNALRELEASNNKLISLNQEKDEFMGMAAHDLKNPLMIIMGNAELIGIARDPVKVKQLIDNIHISVSRMNSLIQNLLDANAIEQGQFRMSPERCNVAELVKRSLQGNHLSAERKGIQILQSPHPQLFVKADANATLQILDNLLSNAIKYSPHDTCIGLIIAAEADHVSISIRDEGPGLSEEDQKLLFRKFTRLTAKPTGGESSNGLGLSIVKRLAEGLDGTVECRSKLGSGSTFTVKLPRSVT